MSEKKKLSPIGEFVEPSKLRSLLHGAEFEYGEIKGLIDIDDTRHIVNERLRAEQEFSTPPSNTTYENDIDCARYMSRRTGLPFLLCVLYMFHMGEGAASRIWENEIDDQARERCTQQFMDMDFSKAVSIAALCALVHPNSEWREFHKDIIDHLIVQEDARRIQKARKLHEAIGNSRIDGTDLIEPAE